MLTAITIHYGNTSIPIQIIRSARKSMALQIKPDQTVYVRAPLKASDDDIKRFVDHHTSWLINKYNLMSVKQERTRVVGLPPWDQLSSYEKSQIKDKISQKVRYYSSIMGVTIGRISIRNQKTRWGSCSSKGNVNFNYRLYYMEEDLMDYVVVHELAHRKHMNHSPAFWQEVARYCPDYMDRRRRLRTFSLSY